MGYNSLQNYTEVKLNHQKKEENLVELLFIKKKNRN